MRKHKLLITTLFCVGLWWAPIQAYELGPIDIHGFISQGYLKSTANDYLCKSSEGSFEYNEAAVNFSANPIDNLRIGMQLFSRDLGDAGNNETVLDWGYADYRVCNELGIRMGKLKTPFGLYNEGRDLDMLRTNVFLPQCVYMEFYRGFLNAMEGGALYGNLNLGAAGTVEYFAGAGGVSVELDNTAFNTAIRPLVLFEGDINNTEIDVRTFYPNRVIWNTPLEGLRLGWTQIYTKSDVKTNSSALPPAITGYPVTVNLADPYSSLLKFRIQVGSGEYKWRGITLAGEYFTAEVTGSMELCQQLAAVLGSDSIDRKQRMRGYYGLAAYRINDWLEIGGYRGVYYINAYDTDGEELVAQDTTRYYLGMVSGVRPDHAAWQKDTCATVRIDINPYWLVKFEVHHMNGTAEVLNYSTIDDLKKDWSLYAFKTTFNF